LIDANFFLNEAGWAMGQSGEAKVPTSSHAAPLIPEKGANYSGKFSDC
jgi:hypothetical protein